MRIVDLFSPMHAADWQPPFLHELVMPEEDARTMAEQMRRRFGVASGPLALPDDEQRPLDRLTLTTPTGAPVHAPADNGSTRGANGPRAVEEMPLCWFYRPGIVLDLTGAPVGAVDAAVLEREFSRIGGQPEPLDIVLLNTGAARRAGTPRYFTQFAGLDGSAIELLLGAGVRVIGTDAFSLDAPMADMVRRYQRTGDPNVLWPVYFAGRERTFCRLERLANLDVLPPRGFTVACFPVKIGKAGAALARTVALVDDRG